MAHSTLTLLILTTLITHATPAEFCKVQSIVGCYADAAQHRILPHQTSIQSTTLTLESCAAQCAADGYGNSTDLIGVEFGSQCFCGHAFDPNQNLTQYNISICQAIKCPGSKSLPGEKPEYCGDADRQLVYHASCTTVPDTPNFMPCTKASPAYNLPFL